MKNANVLQKVSTRISSIGLFQEVQLEFELNDLSNSNSVRSNLFAQDVPIKDIRFNRGGEVQNEPVFGDLIAEVQYLVFIRKNVFSMTTASGSLIWSLIV